MNEIHSPESSESFPVSDGWSPRRNTGGEVGSAARGQRDQFRSFDHCTVRSGSRSAKQTTSNASRNFCASRVARRTPFFAVGDRIKKLDAKVFRTCDLWTDWPCHVKGQDRLSFGIKNYAWQAYHGFTRTSFRFIFFARPPATGSCLLAVSSADWQASPVELTPIA